jgi:6-pyruvoyltetrahydropterin/6-carboxytetrahydropterin synthase
MPKSASQLPVASRKRPSVRALRGTVLVTRQVHFNAAHRLHNPSRSAAWNEEKYGLCNNPRWHGHNYVLEVTVAGEVDPETGYLLDLGELRDLLEARIVKPCDHRNLNEEVPFLRGVIPSTENLVIAFWHELERHITKGRLHAVKLFETPRNFAEYRGPDAFPSL